MKFTENVSNQELGKPVITHIIGFKITIKYCYSYSLQCVAGK